MSEYISSRDVIYVEKSSHHMYKELTEGGDIETAPFRTMKDVFMWVASIGYRMGERRPLNGARQDIFRWAQFSPQVDVPLLKAIAIADRDEIAIVNNQSAMLNIIEEYANAGVSELKAGILNADRQSLWSFISFTESLGASEE